jgi:hypothetical protein
MRGDIVIHRNNQPITPPSSSQFELMHLAVERARFFVNGLTRCDIGTVRVASRNDVICELSSGGATRLIGGGAT